MKIVPVNFNTEQKAMLGHCKMIFEADGGGKIAINPDKFDKLITALRTAVDNDGTLDKEATSYNDIFDAFRLALKFYSFRDSSSLYCWHSDYVNYQFYFSNVSITFYGKGIGKRKGIEFFVSEIEGSWFFDWCCLAQVLLSSLLWLLVSSSLLLHCFAALASWIVSILTATNENVVALTKTNIVEIGAGLILTVMTHSSCNRIFWYIW
jgi:hypothetical protein